jgi:hypothetical protein
MLKLTGEKIRSNDEKILPVPIGDLKVMSSLCDAGKGRCHNLARAMKMGRDKTVPHGCGMGRS